MVCAQARLEGSDRDGAQLPADVLLLVAQLLLLAQAVLVVALGVPGKRTVHPPSIRPPSDNSLEPTLMTEPHD